MEQDNKESIKKELGYNWDFDFGAYFNKGFSLFGNKAGEYIGYTVLFFVIMFATFLFIGITAITVIFPILLMFGFYFVLLPSLRFGYTIMADKQMRGAGTFNDLWGGFRFIPQGMLYVLLNIVVGIVFGIVIFSIFGLGFFSMFDINDFSNPRELNEKLNFVILNNLSKFFMIYFLLFVLQLLLYSLLFFWIEFIVIFKYNVWDALVSSIKICSKKIGYLILFNFVWMLLHFVGMLPCYLGLLVTLPAYFASSVSMFHHAFNINNETKDSLPTVSNNSELLDS